MKLYHATYKAYLDSILRNGLLKKPPQHCWSWGDEYDNEQTGFGPAIFLATDYNVAESFAETADEVDEDIYDSGIAVFEIDSDDLDPELITYDPFYYNNVEEELEDPYFEYSSVLDQCESIAYLGNIDPAFLKIC